jgi:diadenosine tetraphosphate (Ap4A) HIT family hydrolase
VIHRRVEEARGGNNPKVITRVKSGWVVLGDAQFVEGYCLLLPDPVVRDLNELQGHQRSQYLSDMAAIGDAVLEVTGARRINYEILGNLEPALHAHIFPRFDTEPPELKTRPVWFYDWEKAPQFDPVTYAGLMEKLKIAITRRCGL